MRPLFMPIVGWFSRRNAHSQFYKSIHISYPSASDRAVARQKGIGQVAKFFCTACQMVTAG
jgi:hypothetical protein